MSLHEFDLLTDENISPVVDFLRDEGFDVRDVKEEGWVGQSDLTLIRTAFAENRAVLTHDSDFGMLAIASNEPLVGIIYLRPGHIRADYVVETLQTVLHQSPLLKPPFIVVAQRVDHTVRIRIRQL